MHNELLQGTQLVSENSVEYNISYNDVIGFKITEDYLILYTIDDKFIITKDVLDYEKVIGYLENI